MSAADAADTSADRTPKPVCVSPVLRVADVGKALAWYRDTLGWQVAFQWPPPDSGKPAGYAGVCSGDVTLHLSSYAGGAASSVYIFVRGDLDALASRYAANGVTLAKPPETYEYGMREFEVKDPDGNCLSFAQSATNPEIHDGDGKPTD